MKTQTHIFLKFSCYYLTLAFIGLLSSSTAIAQDTADTSQKTPLQLAITGGLNVNFPVGAMPNQWTASLNEEIANLPESYQQSGGTTPVIGPIIGVEILYPINGSWVIGTGLRLARKGYGLKMGLDYKDPDYQFDHFYTHKRKVKGYALEVPLTVTYQFHSKWRLSVAPYWGRMIPSSTSMTMSEGKEVYINGAIDDAWSRPAEAYPIELDQESFQAYWGFSMAIRRELSPSFFLESHIAFSSDYFDQPLSLNTLSTQLSIGYLLTQ